MAVTKIKPIRTTIEKSIAYITNPGKTENCLFVSSEHCFPETAAVEFQFYLDKLRAGGNTIGRHLIQSFAPDEVTPEQAHEIGRKLAGEILGGQYAYILATHLDRDHIHNHFVWCAANLETHKKYRSTKSSYHKIQEASDKLCAEYSLSVITEKSGRRGKSFSEYQADRQGTSWKSQLRKTIDDCIKSASSFDDFIGRMQASGYEVKRGKYISFRAGGQERFTRAKSIGRDYSEACIRERIGSNAAYEIERRYAGCLTKLQSAKSKRDREAKKLAASKKSLGIAGYLQEFKAMEKRQKDEYDALIAEKRRLGKICQNIHATSGVGQYYRDRSRSEVR